MRYPLNIDLVFPIKDEVSAWLMCLKAESLFEAGIIDTDEMSAVLRTSRRSPSTKPRNKQR